MRRLPTLRLCDERRSPHVAHLHRALKDQWLLWRRAPPARAKARRRRALNTHTGQPTPTRSLLQRAPSVACAVCGTTPSRKSLLIRLPIAVRAVMPAIMPTARASSRRRLASRPLMCCPPAQKVDLPACASDGATRFVPAAAAAPRLRQAESTCREILPGRGDNGRWMRTRTQ
jgi:hypothetical protein